LWRSLTWLSTTEELPSGSLTDIDIPRSCP
jgi:hypothetical protein